MATGLDEQEREVKRALGCLAWATQEGDVADLDVQGGIVVERGPFRLAVAFESERKEPIGPADERSGRGPRGQMWRPGDFARARERRQEVVILSKTSGKPGRSPLLAWGAVATVALAALTVALAYIAGESGGPSSGVVERPVVGGDLHAMAVDPQDSDRVMVGGHEGAAISEDGGKTWRQVADLEGADPMGWAIDPTDPRKMFAGGHPGFYRSEDGGQTWSQDNSGLPATDIHGLGMDPQNPDVLYASIMGAGLYRTTAAGGSWELVNAEVAMMGPVLVDPRDPKTLYVAGMEGAFLRSEDGGRSWSELGSLPGGMATWVSQSLKDPDVIYAAGGSVSKSNDGGESWQPLSGGLPQGVSVVAVAAEDPRVVYAGVLDGTEARVYRSEDGGGSWGSRNG